MKPTTSKSVFQMFVALNIFGLTVHALKFPLSASTGNGKRSQPPMTGPYDPDALNRQWLYNQLISGQKLSLVDTKNPWSTAPRKWRFQEQQAKRDGDYMPSSIVTRTNENDDVMSDVDDLLDIPNDLLGRLPLSNDGNMGRFDDLPQYENVRNDYTGNSDVYRSSPLLKSLMALRLRERLRHQAVLRNPYSNRGFDDE